MFAQSVAAPVSPPMSARLKLVFSIPPHRPTPKYRAPPTDPVPSSAMMRRPVSGAWMFCVGAWYRSGLRTSTSVFPISTPKPKESKGNLPSERHSSGGAVSYPWMASTSGRMRRRGSARPIRYRQSATAPSLGNGSFPCSGRCPDICRPTSPHSRRHARSRYRHRPQAAGRPGSR